MLSEWVTASEQQRRERRGHSKRSSPFDATGHVPVKSRLDSRCRESIIAMGIYGAASTQQSVCRAAIDCSAENHDGAVADRLGNVASVENVAERCLEHGQPSRLTERLPSRQSRSRGTDI